MEQEQHLTKDFMRFTILMVIVIGSIVALDLYDLQTGWVGSTAEKIYSFILQ